MTRRGDALSANDGQRRKIVAVARFRVACVQAHAHAHRADLAPALAVDRALRVEGRACGVAGTFEHRAERIADDLKHMAPVRVYRALEQRVMARLRLLHRIGMLLDQSRRALDVGEKKGYGAGWKRLHRESGAIQATACSNCLSRLPRKTSPGWILGSLRMLGLGSMIVDDLLGGVH